MAKLIKASRSGPASKNKTLNIEELNKHKAEAERKPFLTRLRNKTALFVGSLTLFSFLAVSYPQRAKAEQPNKSTIKKAQLYALNNLPLDQQKLNILSKMLDGKIPKALNKAYPEGKDYYEAVNNARKQIIEILKSEGKEPTEENVRKKAREIYESVYEKGINDATEALANNEDFNTYAKIIVKDLVDEAVKAAPYISIAFPTKRDLEDASNYYARLAQEAEQRKNQLETEMDNGYCETNCMVNYDLAIAQNFFYGLMSDTLKDAAPSLLEAYQDMVKAEEARKRAEQYEKEKEEWEKIRELNANTPDF